MTCIIESMPTQSILVIIFACLLYGGLHSLLAARSVRQRVSAWLGPRGQRFYRLAYNLVAGLTALPLFWLAVRLPDAPLYAIPFPWLGLTLLAQFLGLLGLGLAVSQTGAISFMGLDAFVPARPAPPAQLVTTGLYRWVRHPIYTCSLLVLWPVPAMSWNLLALALGLTAYIFIGIYFEERKLLAEFGEAYAEYRRKTPMLIPLRIR